MFVAGCPPGQSVREGPIRGTMRQQRLKPCIVARAFKGRGRSVRMLVMELDPVRCTFPFPTRNGRPLAATGCCPGGSSIFFCYAFEDVKESRIARRLGISAYTVHNHVCRLDKKLGVGSRPELIRLIFSEHIANTCPRCCERCSRNVRLPIEAWFGRPFLSGAETVGYACRGMPDQPVRVWTQ